MAPIVAIHMPIMLKTRLRVSLADCLSISARNVSSRFLRSCFVAQVSPRDRRQLFDEHVGRLRPHRPGDVGVRRETEVVSNVCSTVRQARATCR
jgi:hypothetical protein